MSLTDVAARSTPDPPPDKDPKQPDFVQRAKILIVRRQFQEAIKICRLGLLAHPTYVEGRIVLGMALMALSRYEEVLAEMRVALELDHQNAIALLLKGEALLHKNELAQAKEVLLGAKQLDPLNSKIDTLLEELAEVGLDEPDAAPRSRTQTKLYPAQRAQPVLWPREPSEVLPPIRHRGQTSAAPQPSLPEAEAERPGGQPSDISEDGEEDEYTTAPFLAPNHLVGNRRLVLQGEDSWSEGTVTDDSPIGLAHVPDGKEPGAGQAASDATSALTYSGDRPKGTEWDTSDILSRDNTEEDVGLMNGSFPELGQPLEGSAEEPSLSVLFPASIEAYDLSAPAGAKVAERSGGEDSHETIVNADRPPFGSSSRDDAASGQPIPAVSGRARTPSPRSSVEPTKALEIDDQADRARRATDAPGLLARFPPASASIDDVSRLDESAPEQDEETSARDVDAWDNLRDEVSSVSELSEISVEILPEEMPPLPSDARSQPSRHDSALSPPLPLPPLRQHTAASPAAASPPRALSAPVPAVPPLLPDQDEEEDEFATRVNFDPPQAAVPAAEPPPDVERPDAGLPPEELDEGEPRPRRENLFSTDGSYPSSEEYLATSLRPDGGLAPEESFQPHAPLRDESSLSGTHELSDDSLLPNAFTREVSRAPMEHKVAPLQAIDSDPSYEPPGFSAHFEPDSPDRASLRGAVDSAGSDPRAAGGRQVESQLGNRMRTAALEDEENGAPLADGPMPVHMRTAALEDEENGAPLADGPMPVRAVTHATAMEGPGHRRPPEPEAVRRSIDDRDVDAGSFRSAPARAKARVGKRAQQTVGDRTHTSFLSLLMGEPGSHRGFYLIIFAVVVLAAAAGVGLAVRYVRLGEQIEVKRKQALTRLRAGNLIDYSAAARSYAEILARRPGDLPAVWAHARIQVAIPFEFGDQNPVADKLPGVAGGPGPASTDRLAVEIYSALNAGALDRAADLARAARDVVKNNALLEYLDGRIKLLQGNAAEAERSLALATRHDPQYPLYFRALGDAIAAQGRYAEAKVAFNTALGLNHEHVGAMIGMAKVLLTERAPIPEVQRVVSKIAKAPYSRGQRGWAYVLEADLLVRQGQSADVDKALSLARANAPIHDPAFYDEMARVLIEGFQLGQAEQAVRESKRIMSGRPQPSYYQAQVYVRNGLPGPALAELVQARSLSFAASAVLRAQIYLELGQLGAADAAVNEALSLPGDQLEAYLVRARILTARRAYTQAAEQLSALLLKNPGSVPLLTALAEVYIAEGRREIARDTLRLATEKDKNDSHAQLRLAQLQELEGKWQEAKLTLEAAHRVSYGNVAIQKELARVEGDTGVFSEAISNYQQVLRRVPADTNTRLALIRVLTLQRELDAADQELKRVEGQQFERSALALAKGRLALARGDARSALTYFEGAKSSQKSNLELLDLMVRAQLESQNEAEARHTVQEMQRLSPGSPEAELALARVEYAAGRLPAAVRALTRAVHALARNPRPPLLRAEIRVLLGRAHQDSGNGAAAEDAFQTAAKDCSSCSDPLVYRALLLDERGNAEEALRLLESAVKIDPRRADAFYWLGVIRERQGQSDLARESYQKCLTLHPSEDHRAAAAEALKNLGGR